MYFLSDQKQPLRLVLGVLTFSGQKHYSWILLIANNAQLPVLMSSHVVFLLLLLTITQAVQQSYTSKCVSIIRPGMLSFLFIPFIMFVLLFLSPSY